MANATHTFKTKISNTESAVTVPRRATLGELKALALAVVGIAMAPTCIVSLEPTASAADVITMDVYALHVIKDENTVGENDESTLFETHKLMTLTFTVSATSVSGGGKLCTAVTISKTAYCTKLESVLGASSEVMSVADLTETVGQVLIAETGGAMRLAFNTYGPVGFTGGFLLHRELDAA